ncbi:hypothetical protein BDV95DRAFT_628946 [Massariosphaeria phaeospora]|uniref:P-loop containing nucleoside triphosphate hydrolase protein n=1 Tax=Massariosphaeria phaeospora TaxID=100035 RepID=A0A7C8I8T3_9PLEO|nr:hypothetical protein BDV95DRAFT_628946 [Massariosphaeria phaeospora]
MTAPLVWWDVKQHIDRKDQDGLHQYAVLGHAPEETGETPKPVLLNTNMPWSAFLCGSQGSGKSHTLSCMLENCMLEDDRIGKNPHPLAGLVFHYDSSQSSGMCEAAYLCSSIPTTVLVSPSNYGRLKQQYEAMAAKQGEEIKVERLRLLPSHLNTERVKTLMAVGKGDEIPLYMHLLIKILRDMATEREGSGEFNYTDFVTRLASQSLMDKQNQPLQMRLHLLESFLDIPRKSPSLYSSSDSSPKALVRHTGPNNLIGRPGTLTVIDLTDPIIDADSACVLFDICLSVYLSQTHCGKIVALDEAHNYMSEESAAAKQFTGKLLKTIREQRHQGARVVIATQEPTINTSLLDLCSITMVHRCTSPAWFTVLKKHVAALFLSKSNAGDGEEENGQVDDRVLFEIIVRLKLGESLLFCPTAAIDVEEEQGVLRMVGGYVKFRTRKRLTADGGQSKLAGDASV